MKIQEYKNGTYSVSETNPVSGYTTVTHKTESGDVLSKIVFDWVLDAQEYSNEELAEANT